MRLQACHCCMRCMPAHPTHEPVSRFSHCCYRTTSELKKADITIRPLAAPAGIIAAVNVVDEAQVSPGLVWSCACVLHLLVAGVSFLDATVRCPRRRIDNLKSEDSLVCLTFSLHGREWNLSAFLSPCPRCGLWCTCCQRATPVWRWHAHVLSRDSMMTTVSRRMLLRIS